MIAGSGKAEVSDDEIVIGECVGFVFALAIVGGCVHHRHEICGLRLCEAKNSV